MLLLNTSFSLIILKIEASVDPFSNQEILRKPKGLQPYVTEKNT
jgi:hypothetical protein